MGVKSREAPGSPNRKRKKMQFIVKSYVSAVVGSFIVLAGLTTFIKTAFVLAGIFV